jgi:group I intron endonuclease
MSIGIYKITSPSGKIYIGQSQNINIRWKYSYYNICCKDQIKLYNSLKKYSPKSHIFEILEKCTLEELNEREIFWKKYYLKQLGWKKLLFCKLYDIGGGPLSEEIKDKIRKGNLGRKHSKKTKIKMSKKAKGRKYSLASRKKMSLSKKGKELTKNQKLSNFGKGRPLIPIIQYNLQGDFIKEWSSSKEIKEILGFHDSGIVNCCKGVQNTSKGYKWKYK